jgi:hypothetical protein
VSNVAQRVAAVIRLPEPHVHQEVFAFWDQDHPDAQVLVAPCGTKLGKTFGSSLWLLSQALANPGFYCVWIAPTTYKCQIAFRYMKAMLPDMHLFDCKDGRLEIWLGNGSVIKFLHGKDAEVTVEGEAVDAFVIDETGKQTRQLWFSLFTTITQTGGKGIITGTPRGTAHWYYDVFRQAKSGDPFFCWAQLPTRLSPFVTEKAIEQARRLLPKHLFDQYYEAIFTSQSSVYGDLSHVWQRDLLITRPNLWLHPDETARHRPTTIGVDLAKRNDWTVFFAVNDLGMTTGYARFRGKPYQTQAKLLARFVRDHFKEGEIPFDRTGVGDAVAEMLGQAIDDDKTIAEKWALTPVVFTNSLKQQLVSANTMAIEEGWWKCPPIDRIEHEFQVLEVASTKNGAHTYGAPDGDYDDAHWAAALAIAGARRATSQDAALDVIEAALSGKLLTSLEDDEDATELDDDLSLEDALADDADTMDIDEEMD